MLEEIVSCVLAVLVSAIGTCAAANWAFRPARDRQDRKF